MSGRTDDIPELVGLGHRDPQSRQQQQQQQQGSGRHHSLYADSPGAVAALDGSSSGLGCGGDHPSDSQHSRLPLGRDRVRVEEEEADFIVSAGGASLSPSAADNPNTTPSANTTTTTSPPINDSSAESAPHHSPRLAAVHRAWRPPPLPASASASPSPLGPTRSLIDRAAAHLVSGDTGGSGGGGGGGAAVSNTRSSISAALSSPRSGLSPTAAGAKTRTTATQAPAVPVMSTAALAMVMAGAPPDPVSPPSGLPEGIVRQVRAAHITARGSVASTASTTPTAPSPVCWARLPRMNSDSNNGSACAAAGHSSSVGGGTEGGEVYGGGLPPVLRQVPRASLRGGRGLLFSAGGGEGRRTRSSDEGINTHNSNSNTNSTAPFASSPLAPPGESLRELSDAADPPGRPVMARMAGMMARRTVDRVAGGYFHKLWRFAATGEGRGRRQQQQQQHQHHQHLPRWLRTDGGATSNNSGGSGSRSGGGREGGSGSLLSDSAQRAVFNVGPAGAASTPTATATTTTSVRQAHGGGGGGNAPLSPEAGSSATSSSRRVSFSSSNWQHQQPCAAYSPLRPATVAAGAAAAGGGGRGFTVTPVFASQHHHNRSMSMSGSGSAAAAAAQSSANNAQYSGMSVNVSGSPPPHHQQWGDGAVSVDVADLSHRSLGGQSSLSLHNFPPSRHTPAATLGSPSSSRPHSVGSGSLPFPTALDNNIIISGGGGGSGASPQQQQQQQQQPFAARRRSNARGTALLAERVIERISRSSGAAGLTTTTMATPVHARSVSGTSSLLLSLSLQGRGGGGGSNCSTPRLAAAPGARAVPTPTIVTTNTNTASFSGPVSPLVHRGSGRPSTSASVEWQREYVAVTTAEVSQRLLLRRREHRRRQRITALIDEVNDLGIIAALRSGRRAEALEKARAVMETATVAAGGTGGECSSSDDDDERAVAAAVAAATAGGGGAARDGGRPVWQQRRRHLSPVVAGGWTSFFPSPCSSSSSSGEYSDANDSADSRYLGAEEGMGEYGAGDDSGHGSGSEHQIWATVGPDGLPPLDGEERGPYTVGEADRGTTGHHRGSRRQSISRGNESDDEGEDGDGAVPGHHHHRRPLWQQQQHQQGALPTDTMRSDRTAAFPSDMDYALAGLRTVTGGGGSVGSRAGSTHAAGASGGSGRRGGSPVFTMPLTRASLDVVTHLSAQRQRSALELLHSGACVLGPSPLGVAVTSEGGGREGGGNRASDTPHVDSDNYGGDEEDGSGVYGLMGPHAGGRHRHHDPSDPQQHLTLEHSQSATRPEPTRAASTAIMPASMDDLVAARNRHS